MSLGFVCKYPELVEFYNENGYMYDFIEDMKGYGSALNSAAGSMETNVNNCLFMTFDQRIIRMFRMSGKSAQNAILRRVRSYECRKCFVFQEHEHRFIDTCKEILDAGDICITYAWILQNPYKVLKLFRNLIQQCEKMKSRASQFFLFFISSDIS